MHYIYSTKCETGGEWFPKVFFLICLSVVGFQITTFGGIVVLCAVKSNNGNGKAQSAIVFATAVATILFYIVSIYFFYPKSNFDNNNVFIDDELYLDDRASIASSVALSQSSDPKVYNPAIAKPLTKIWVRDDQVAKFEELYELPEHSSFLEYSREI